MPTSLHESRYFKTAFFAPVLSFTKNADTRTLWELLQDELRRDKQMHMETYADVEIVASLKSCDKLKTWTAKGGNHPGRLH